MLVSEGRAVARERGGLKQLGCSSAGRQQGHGTRALTLAPGLSNTVVICHRAGELLPRKWCPAPTMQTQVQRRAAQAEVEAAVPFARHLGEAVGSALATRVQRGSRWSESHRILWFPGALERCLPWTVAVRCATAVSINNLHSFVKKYIIAGLLWRSSG